MRQWIRSALVRIMACRLFGAKPLSEPNWNVVNCTLGYKKTSLELKSKYKHFHSRKCIWNHRLRNGGHFVQWGSVNSIYCTVNRHGPDYQVKNVIIIITDLNPILVISNTLRKLSTCTRLFVYIINCAAIMWTIQRICENKSYKSIKSYDMAFVWILPSNI